MSDPLAAPSLYINRELSWLEFNARVLHEAFDERNPLLERLKFLSIFSFNLDEFYMVRVAGLRRQLAANVGATAPDAMTPQEQLEAIRRRVGELLRCQRECLHEQLLPALARHGIRFVQMDELDAAGRAAVNAYFESDIFPVLTPLAVDPGHPFPYISNLSLSLAVQIRDPRSDTHHFARVKVPKSLPRWVPFGQPNQFVPLEQVIGSKLGTLFPGMEVQSWYAFRITRNSDIEVGPPDEGEDLLDEIEEQVFRRRFGEVVRLEVEAGMPQDTRALLIEELRDDRLPPQAALDEHDIHEVGPLLELGDLLEVASLDIPELRDAPHTPVTPPLFRPEHGDVFKMIRERDVLVHHPYDSFAATVEQFLESAAADEHVLAIKLTLYRTSGDTPIVRALTEAAQRGKQVVVLVELKARFDEVNNITWARTLESAGVHVVYGVLALKTHAKTALVVRRDADGIRRYVHIGTGNYNSKTARVYTDLGLFTSNPSIGADLSDLFNFLTGFSRQVEYRKLLVAPGVMREQFLHLVEREADHARSGRPAQIVAKMNNLTDPELIRALFRASQAGVDIRLLVRSVCCLRPGVKGISDNIRVASIVGRFLEHSRLWYFANGGDEEYYLGSADWMTRSFDHRVEAVVPVEDPTLHGPLRLLLGTLLHDNRQAWDLASDGSYSQRNPGPAPVRAAQVALIGNPWGDGGMSRLAVPPLAWDSEDRASAPVHDREVFK